jgi:hypothetical protein
MKRSTLALFGALLLTATPLFALQGGPKPKVKAPKPPSPATQTTKVKPVSVKTTVSKPKLTTKSTKPAKNLTSAKIKATTKPAKVEKVKSVKVDKTTKSASKGSTTATTPTTTTSSTPTTDPVTLTKVQEKLQRNTNLANKLKDRLPPGTDLMLAAEGFTNLGKFVSAVNVAHNHSGIEFEALKTLIVDEGFSLGQAMQKLKAEGNVTLDVQRAESEAQKMIAASEVGSTSTTTTTTATKTKKSKKPVGGQQ